VLPEASGTRLAIRTFRPLLARNRALPAGSGLGNSLHDRAAWEKLWPIPRQIECRSFLGAVKNSTPSAHTNSLNRGLKPWFPLPRP